MKYRKNISFMLLFIFLITQSFARLDRLDQTILQVSTSLNQFKAAEGSVEGGTIVYIKGTGFNAQASKNQVWIGPYPCQLMADGATQQSLSCRTTRAYDSSKQWGQPITISVDSKITVLCNSANCRFNYRSDLTPIIHQIFPRSAVGNQVLTVYGQHRITDLGDGRSEGEGQVQIFRIDDITCSLIDLQDLQKDQITSSYREPIKCRTYLNQEAGEYQFSAYVDPGKAKLSIRMTQTSFLTGQNYTQRIIPSISQLSSHKGGEIGHQLKATGTGFSKNLDNYQCKISGQTCEVVEVDGNIATIKVPTKSGANTLLGKLEKEAGDSSAQEKPYLGSNGVLYSRYQRGGLWKTSEDWLTYLQGSHSLVLEEEKVITELSTPQIYDSDFVEYVRGYFYAPNPGSYRFSGAADDILIMKLSSVSGNANKQNLQLLLDHNAYTYSHYQPFVRTNLTQVTKNVTLSQGYYYFQLAHIDTGYSGFFKVLVDMPSIHAQTANPTWQIDQIHIKPSQYTAEQIQVKVGATSGGFELFYFVQQVDGTYLRYSASVIVGATASQFSEAIKGLNNINQYGPTVTRQTLDSSNVITTNSGDIASYIYKIEVVRYRSQNIALPSTNDTSMVTLTRTIKHSSPLSGQFKILTGGVPLEKSDGSTLFKYNDGAWIIAEAFNLRYLNTEISVDQVLMTYQTEEIHLVIEYVGLFKTADPITLNLQLIEGGKQGSTIQSSITTLREYSTRPLFSSVPYDFIFNPSDKPTLELKINSIPAVCSDCSYEFDAAVTPVVSSATLSGSSLTLTVTDPSSAGFSIEDIQVYLLGVQCTDLSGNLASFTCSLPENTDTTVQLPGGTGKVSVHVAQLGYSDNSGLSDETVSVTVTSITPNSVSPGGGIQATLVGTGFPLSQECDFSLSICGNTVDNFVSVTNQQIKFMIPSENIACTGTNSILTVNGQTAQISFTYDSSITPIISSLSKASSSPILKSSITITGSNFGTQLNTKVFLEQEGVRKYELTTLSVSSTQIQCILGGGKSGLYDVVVSDATVGASVPSVSHQFEYRIIINSLSIISGPKGGGYQLTINGENLAPSMGSNNVFIGNTKNSLCQILSASESSIVCRVPRMMDEDTVDTPLGVVVTGRILEQSQCRGTCQFTYVEASTAIVNVPSDLDFEAGETVNITGNGLAGATVAVGGKDCTILSSTNTLISFKYPALSSGEYEIIINTATGWTYPQLQSTTPLKFKSLSSYAGSNNGHRIIVNGNGFTSDKLTVDLICSNTKQLDILSVNPDEITIQIPPFEADTVCKVNVTIAKQFKTFGYSYLPQFTGGSSLTDLGSGSYGISENNLTNAAFNRVQFVLLDSLNQPTTSIYEMDITQISASYSTLALNSGYLPSGTFKVIAHKILYGYTKLTPSTVTITSTSSASISSPITASFVGGKQLTINWGGFVTINPENNQVSVCNLQAEVISATNTQAVIKVPALVTSQTQSDYSIADIEKVNGLVISDTVGQGYQINDDSFNTKYSSDNPECFIGYDFGEGIVADVHQIKFAPNPAWAISATYLEGGVFQGSDDNTNWNQIFTIDTSEVHSGWNLWENDGNSIKYRYIRFKHTSVSKCQLVEIQIIGYKLSTISVASGGDQVCDVKIVAGNIVLSSQVTYSAAATSKVTSLDKYWGPSIGGDSLSITGQNFGTSVSVTIDGIQCSVTSQTATTIVCTTGTRSKPPTQGNSFVVTSDGNSAKILGKPYLYADRWSEQATWGGEAIPRQGDTIYVPKGMTLLVDVPSTPILDTIIIEGKIIFSDQQDTTIDAYYFLIIAGEFQAGTEDEPYQNKLTITLHGDYMGKQLPTFGNKVLGCLNCVFNMHGKPKLITWTQVLSTISVGDSSFEVLVPVDWVAGDKIAIAATSYNHYETEEKQILSISANKSVITVKTPFKYRHYAAVETFGAVDFPMRAQVGLLTRNIKVQGAPGSEVDEYGSHLMLRGKQKQGLIGKLSYAQFTHCGQPKIIGRYCTHFHMAGDVPKSYVRGIAVHHSFARVLTIHGTHFLLVEKNVGYNVKGHNIFIEDGIETNNVIQDNLMMSSIVSLTMLQSDITVASYWITNPYNTVRRNHAAGGDFYGFWYEIKQHPDGPSATSDICPMGMQLGESRDNVAHSNKRFGLRIFKLSSRKYPCLDTQDESAIDPYVTNPPIHSLFDNYTLWKNEECGFLGEQLGHMTIRNFKTADSRKGGLQFHKTNYTKQLVIAQNALVVGYSAGNKPADVDITYENSRGIIAARTDGLKFSGLTFWNFGATMTPLQSCSQCWNKKVWVTGGKTTQFESVQYNNILGNYIFWEKWRRQIFIDLDGTLSKPFKDTITPAIPNQSKAIISPNRPSLLVPDHCFDSGNDLWDDSVFCDETITLRGILFSNAIPQIDFLAIDLKSNLLADPYENLDAQNEVEFSSQPEIIIKKSRDIKHSWAMPFATNQYYNVHWKWGIDFRHISIAPSRLWDENDGTVLRFNYTDARQLFQIGKWYQQQLQLPFITGANALIDPSTCQNGDYYHDKDQMLLFVCVSGRNKQIREWIDVNGIKCLNFCPEENLLGDREEFERPWSNTTMWPGGVLPAVGENVTIPYEWNVVLDIDTPVFNYVKINGILIYDRSRASSTFEAHYIWVSQGIIRIGSEASPFLGQANIILHGNKADKFLVIDSDASGNKMLAVTGGLQFFGKVPGTVWTRLLQTAVVGSTSIKVQSSNGWKVGDKIVVAPSYAGRKQYEQVVIESISGNTITFATPLSYEHYGAAGYTISNDYGTLDARSAVGVLSRNIKVKSSVDPNGWGARVLIYGYLQIPQDPMIPPYFRNGYAKLKGVEFDGCSQYDTTDAALKIQNIGSDAFSPNIQITEVQGSSFHNCGGYCVYIDDSANVSINNNVVFGARKFLVYVEDILSDYNFTNNLLIGAKKRDQILSLEAASMVDDISCYQHYFTINFANPNHNIKVTSNLCQGSEGEGFVFPSSPCQYLSTYPFINNTAGSCEVAFMFETLPGQTCLSASGAIGYASQIGLMANQPGSHQKLIYENMFFADNKRGITLRYAHQIDDNTCIFRNSYIVGISRPDCPSCYGSTKISYCNEGYAVRMFTATITGQKFPLAKKPTGHDVICTQQAYDFKAFLHNVTFQNYLYTNPQIPYCSSMSVFKRHSGASDGTASHSLTQCKCINCQKQSWAFFDKPSVGWRGWFGGCGQLDCTGPNNYLINDQDGMFTGQESQLLSNNTMVGNGEQDCEYVPAMNGHWCHTQDLAVLEYQSLASDFNKRIMWPIYLNYDGGNWQSVTNGWKQWQWDGDEPMNLRLARFWSVFKLHKTYNMTYSSQPPSDARYQIQKRLVDTGNSSDWAIIRVYFPVPNSIEVLIKNSTGKDIRVKPYPIKAKIPVDLTAHTDICGANNYHYQNGTIQFVVNAINNCQVRVRLSSFIQLSARLDIPFNDFYTNNGATTFITNICAFLGIDTGRMKIVGVYQGSTMVESQISMDAIDLDSATSTQRDINGQYNYLTDLEERLRNGLDGNKISLGSPLLSYKSSFHTFNDDGSQFEPKDEEEQQSKGDKTLIIVLATVIPITLIILAVSGYIYSRKTRAKIHEAQQIQNKSSVHRETINGTTDFDLSAVSEFNATGKKWANT